MEGFILMLWGMLRSLARCIVPAFTSADLTTLFDLLKEMYDPVIAEQQNQEAFTWREFMEDAEAQLIGGKGWVFDTKMGGNQEGIGARAERDALPDAGHQRWKQGTVTPKYHYGTFELTGQLIKGAMKDPQAFANAKTDEMEGLTRDVIKDLNRAVYGDGSGILATCNGTDGTKTFDVYDGMYLRTNMLVDVWNGNTLVGDGAHIESMAVQADGSMRVTYDITDFSTSDGYVIIRKDAAKLVGGTRTGLELEGFKSAIDDGTSAATYMGITRATYPLWKGNLLDNGGSLRNVSLDLHQQAEDAIVEMHGKRPTWMRMNLGQRRKFFSLVAPDRRFDSKNFDAGFERLSYNGVEVTIDIDHPKNEITYVCKDEFKKYEMAPFGILNLDGLTMRMVSGYDLWRGYLGLYGNMATKTPNAHARIVDLQEPTIEVRIRG